MSHWDYRVVRRVIAGEPELSIHEAYYRDDGSVRAITEDPVGVHGSTMEELVDDSNAYFRALDKPVLDYDSICDTSARPADDHDTPPGQRHATDTKDPDQ